MTNRKMTIRKGGYYRDRQGRIHGPMIPLDKYHSGWTCGSIVWAKDGMYSPPGRKPKDLVSEVFVYDDEPDSLFVRNPNGTVVDNHGTLYIPVDPLMVTDAFTPVRAGKAKKGEFIEVKSEEAPGKYHMFQVGGAFNMDPFRIIYEKLPPKIEIPTTICPEGWWIARGPSGVTCVYKQEPKISQRSGEWELTGGCYPLPPPVIAQICDEWQKLDWVSSKWYQSKKEVVSE